MGTWNNWTQTSMEAQDYLFRRIDASGNYLPHQAIYEFAPYRILQYCEASLLLSILDRLRFNNFIDIGCAEGFYPRLVSARYGVESYGVDLSVSGIYRMKEYHKLEGISADAHALPVKDDTFDVVLCSNTVEHVSSPKQVIDELARIARKYVLIGVPQALTHKQINSFRPDFNAQRDQHVHVFTKSTFSKILPLSYPVTIHYANSLSVLAFNAFYKRTIGRISHCLPLVKTMLNLDRLVCKVSPRGAIFMLAKIDLTGGDNAPIQEKEKNGNIPDFVLKGIYKLNRKELDSTVLNLGTSNSRKWREYMVKSSEPDLSDEASVSDKVLAFLACPKCKNDVVLSNNMLVCKSCGANYTIKNGIPIMHDLQSH